MNAKKIGRPKKAVSTSSIVDEFLIRQDVKRVFNVWDITNEVKGHYNRVSAVVSILRKSGVLERVSGTGKPSDPYTYRVKDITISPSIRRRSTIEYKKETTSKAPERPTIDPSDNSCSNAVLEIAAKIEELENKNKQLRQKVADLQAMYHITQIPMDTLLAELHRRQDRMPKKATVVEVKPRFNSKADHRKSEVIKKRI